MDRPREAGALYPWAGGRQRGVCVGGAGVWIETAAAYRGFLITSLSLTPRP